MRTQLVLPSLLLAFTLLGCDKERIVESTAPAPSQLHGGILVPLSGDEGYVELLNGKRERKGKEWDTTVVAYVLQADKQTAFSPTPTLVVLKLETAKGPVSVPLQAKPDAADAAGSTRFVSKSGDYVLDQRGGEVNVTAGGKTLTGTFRGPR